MLLLVLFNKANASQSVENHISFNLHFNAWSIVAFSLNSFSNIASAVELRRFLLVLRSSRLTLLARLIPVIVVERSP